MGWADRYRMEQQHMIRVLKCQEGDSDKFDLCWMAIHLGRVLLMNDAAGK